MTDRKTLRAAVDAMKPPTIVKQWTVQFQFQLKELKQIAGILEPHLKTRAACGDDLRKAYAIARGES